MSHESETEVQLSEIAGWLQSIYKDQPSLRQLYAGMAMQGLLACPNGREDIPFVVERSVQFADALIVELEKKKEL